MSGDLERRYRRVLRLLPGYYRRQWEEDMVAAFLDSALTGDPDEDEFITEYGRPDWPEVASVACLAARLYLGGAGTPRRYFAWGQAVRGTVLAVTLAHAVRGLGQLVLLGGSRYQIGWLLPQPAAAGTWPTVSYLIGYTWVVAFLALALGYYRVARVIAALVIAADLAVVLQGQLTGALPPFASWPYWILLDLAPVLAMAAFHRDAPPPARRPWLVALPASYLLVSVPLLAAEMTGLSAWVPDTPGLCCILASLLCLVHVPKARSSRAGTGVWSLTLVLLAAVAALYKITWLAVYLQGPRSSSHLIAVGLAELLILAVAATLVAPDAARAQATVPAPPRPQLG